ncbi:unnamed protein product [Prunus brigantina]
MHVHVLLLSISKQRLQLLSLVSINLPLLHLYHQLERLSHGVAGKRPVFLVPRNAIPNLPLLQKPCIQPLVIGHGQQHELYQKSTPPPPSSNRSDSGTPQPSHDPKSSTAGPSSCKPVHELLSSPQNPEAT